VLNHISPQLSRGADDANFVHRLDWKQNVRYVMWDVSLVPGRRDGEWKPGRPGSMPIVTHTAGALSPDKSQVKREESSSNEPWPVYLTRSLGRASPPDRTGRLFVVPPEADHR